MKKSPKRLNSIIIAGKKFAIIYEKMEDSWGECDADKMQIKLHTDCLKNDTLYHDTLMHECLHAVFALSGVRYSCFHGNANKEEGAVRALEALFLPLINTINQDR